MQHRDKGNYLLWLVDVTFPLSNEYVCGCQNNFEMTSIHYLLLNSPSTWVVLSFLWVHSGAKSSCNTWSLCCIWPVNSIIIQYSPFHALPDAFVVIIFVQCTVASAPTPSAALPCSGLCNSETDLNTVSTVIVPLNTVQCSLPQRTLERHLSLVSPLLWKPWLTSPTLTNSHSQSSPAQIFFFPSRPSCREGILAGWNELTRG